MSQLTACNTCSSTESLLNLEGIAFEACPVLPDEIKGTEPECPKGDTGAKGDRGEPGINGVDGKSAYQEALDNGFRGTKEEWLKSLQGKDGAQGEAGKDASLLQLKTPVFITPPIEEGKLRTLNDPQKCLKIGDTYYQWYLLNDNADINHKTETDNHGMGGGTVWYLTTSKDLVSWTNQRISLNTGTQTNGDIITSVMTGSALVWNEQIHYFASIDIGEGGKSVGHWIADNIESTPVYHGVVLQNKNMETFRDPHVFPYGKGLRMVIAVDGGIAVYSSSNGDNWNYISTTLINNLGLIECPQLVNTFKYGWVLIFGANEYLSNGTTGTHMATVSFDGNYVKIIKDSKLDLGPDYYAGNIYQNDNGELYSFGWTNSWSYFPNIMQDGFNGYIVVNRIENIGGAGPEAYKFIQQPIKEMYSHFYRSLESNVKLSGDYSNLPIKYVPNNCIQEINIDNGDLADGCFFEFTHGGSNSFKIIRDGVNKGWTISRKDYGLRPAMDIFDWNKDYTIMDDKSKVGLNKTVIQIAKFANVVQIYIDYTLAYTCLVYFPIGNPIFRFHGNEYFDKTGVKIGQDEYKAFYKMFYVDLIQQVEGGLTKLDVDGLLGKEVSDKIATFKSDTEDEVKQITVDTKDGIVIRKQMGTNVNNVEAGLKGVLVHKLREPLLIETQNDDDHLIIKKFIVNKEGFITIEDKNGLAVSGKLFDGNTSANLIETLVDDTHLHVKYVAVDPATGYIAFDNGYGDVIGGYFANEQSLNEFVKSAYDNKALEVKYIRVSLEDQKVVFSNGKQGDAYKEIGGFLADEKNIVFSSDVKDGLITKYISVDKKTGFISFEDKDKNTINGYLAKDDGDLVIRTVSDGKHLKIKDIALDGNGYISFIDKDNNTISGNLFNTGLVEDYIKTTKGAGELKLEQIKTVLATGEINLIGKNPATGGDVIVQGKLMDKDLFPVYSEKGSTQIDKIEYDRANEQFKLTNPLGSVIVSVKGNEYISSIEVI